MNSKGILILSIIWTVLSPIAFLTENTALGIIWLCAGAVGLIIGLIKRKKEEANKA